MSFTELLTKGGPVVWILAGYSIVALTIVLERTLLFLAMGRPAPDLEARLAEAVRANTLEGELGAFKGPEIRVVAGLMEASREGVRELGRVASRIGSQELQRMERGFRTLGFLGNTAPLLGLFGTITGMIKAFMVIEQAGGRVDAQALAGGIWEAMVTTGVGLAVSIPVLLMLHLLEGAADRRAQVMRSCASVVLEQLPHDRDPEVEQAVHHREGVVHAV